MLKTSDKLLQEAYDQIPVKAIPSNQPTFASRPLSLSSKTTKTPLKDGVYSVLDAWNKQHSGYVIAVKGGKVVKATGRDAYQNINIDMVNKYYTEQGFDILHAVSASVCSNEPEAGGEEEQMLGNKHHEAVQPEAAVVPSKKNNWGVTFS